MNIQCNMSLLFLFVSLRLLQLQSKGNWLGQRKIFMLKPQELKPKSSAVTCCQETCRCFSFCSLNTYRFSFWHLMLTPWRWSLLTLFLRLCQDPFFSLSVCVSLLPQKLFMEFVIRILFQNCWTVCYSSLSVCLLYGEGTGWAKKGGGQTANKC